MMFVGKIVLESPDFTTLESIAVLNAPGLARQVTRVGDDNLIVRHNAWAYQR